MAEKLDMMSKNNVQANIEKIKALFPNAVTEVLRNGKPTLAVDFDVLKQEMSDSLIDDKEERYQFTWPDKKKSILLANSPISATLRPYKEESVDFDNTENLYIEGDNLDVLKLLQETYLGKIKMIYIDPPYNTGNDFLYNDNFVETAEEYLADSGQYDEIGNRLYQNTESNGRFHTDWLNLMFPRLKIAKDLLTEDGLIFISIDDNEVENLKKICDEIFGQDNFINIIALKTKASAGASGGGEDKRLKKNAEFILIYSKNKNLMFMEQPVEYISIADFIQEHKENNVGFYYTRILEDFGDKTLLADLGDMKVYQHSNFKFSTVSEKMKEGLTLNQVYDKYFDRIFMVTNAQTSLLTKVNKITPSEQLLVSYEYIPKTGKDKNKTISKYVWNKTLVVWFADSAIKNKNGVFKAEQIGTLWDDISWGRLDLQGDVPFKNGKKPLKLLERLISMATYEDSIVLDFFSGSATTAHAVMTSNLQDGGHRKFIMVQIPEKCDEKSDAYKMGLATICELGKERIRRSGNKIKTENGLTANSLDTGFRVLKLDSSNMKDVFYRPSDLTLDLLSSLESNIKEDRTPFDLLFQVMLELGKPLSAKIEEKEIAGKRVFIVNDDDLIACFDDDVTSDVVKTIAEMKPLYAVFRDSSLADDCVGANFDQIFATYSPNTTRKVL